MEDVCLPMENSQGQCCSRQGPTWDSEQRPGAQGNTVPTASCLMQGASSALLQDAFSVSRKEGDPLLDSPRAKMKKSVRRGSGELRLQTSECKPWPSPRAGNGLRAFPNIQSPFVVSLCASIPEALRTPTERSTQPPWSAQAGVFIACHQHGRL